MHLLAGRDQGVVALAVQPVEHVQPLLVEREHLRGRIQRFADFRLAEMLDVAFDGVVHPAALAEGIVDPYLTIQTVHGLAEHVPVQEVGHVAVVVDPLRSHHRLVMRRRRSRPALPAVF